MSALTVAEGQPVLVTFTFRGPDNAPENPASVTVRYRDANNERTSLTYAGGGVTRTSTGVYTVLVQTTGLVGRWYFRAESPEAASLDVEVVVVESKT